jgi:hypothetical protein
MQRTGSAIFAFHHNLYVPSARNYNYLYHQSDIGDNTQVPPNTPCYKMRILTHPITKWPLVKTVRTTDHTQRYTSQQYDIHGTTKSTYIQEIGCDRWKAQFTMSRRLQQGNYKIVIYCKFC